MMNDTESGDRYLSLALAARTALKSLQGIARGDQMHPDMGNALGSFLLNIEDERDDSYLKRLQASTDAPSFEAASTCAEISQRLGVEDLRDAFRIVARGKDGGDVVKSAQRLIEFFDAIEVQALDRYSSGIQSRMA
jgi:hypothetical protein